MKQSATKETYIKQPAVQLYSDTSLPKVKQGATRIDGSVVSEIAQQALHASSMDQAIKEAIDKALGTS